MLTTLRNPWSNVLKSKLAFWQSRRHHVQMSVPYCTLRNDVFSEMLNLVRRSFEDTDFEAVVMIEMDMHARYRK